MANRVILRGIGGSVEIVDQNNNGTIELETDCIPEGKACRPLTDMQGVIEERLKIPVAKLQGARFHELGNFFDKRREAEKFAKRGKVKEMEKALDDAVNIAQRSDLRVGVETITTTAVRKAYHDECLRLMRAAKTEARKSHPDPQRIFVAISDARIYGRKAVSFGRSDDSTVTDPFDPTVEDDPKIKEVLHRAYERSKEAALALAEKIEKFPREIKWQYQLFGPLRAMQRFGHMAGVPREMELEQRLETLCGDEGCPKPSMEGWPEPPPPRMRIRLYNPERVGRLRRDIELRRLEREADAALDAAEIKQDPNAGEKEDPDGIKK